MRYQVAIVGGGPTGATLANLLGRRGLSVCILEKRKRPYNLPRAVHFDGETMRVFQAAGLADEIVPRTLVGRGMLFKNMNGDVLVDWSRDQTVGPMGWYESYRFHQPDLEEVLIRGLERFPNVSLLTGIEVRGIEQQPGHVRLGLAECSEIEADYVVGCDGATSTLRQLLEIENDELGFEERWLITDLMLRVPRDNLGDYSIQYCDPDNPATYVRSIGNRRRWEMRLDADHNGEVGEDEIWDRLKRWITVDDATLERSAVYTFRSVLAKSWQQGRCFLAGDAAHQMPPFMGQGMCAGIRDAGNLAWKLDQVLRGARASVLESYQSERSHNVRQFIELSVRLGKLINQTATGDVPKGQMKSIWPCLGAGLGPRDGIGGELAPQVVDAEGKRADDLANQGFYVLAKRPMETDFPVFDGEWDRLDDHGFDAALIRPDGYALAGVNGPEDIAEALVLNGLA